MKVFPGGNKSFCCWNVHGLGSKLDDLDFLSHVNNFDFISLIETWSSDKTKINIPNYSYFHLHREKNKRARRYSGGVIFFFKDQYKHYVKQLPSKSTDVLWVRVDRKLLGLSKDLFICSVYISPSTSKTHKFAENHVIEILEEEISKYNTEGFILLGGDFNSRLGNLNDFVEDDTFHENIPNNPS